MFCNRQYNKNAYVVVTCIRTLIKIPIIIAQNNLILEMIPN